MADDHNATATCSASDITVYSTSTNGYWSPTEKFDDLDSRIYCFARTEYDKNSMPMITFGFSSVNLSSTRRSKVTPHQFTISVTFKDLHHCVLLYESKQLMVTARSLTFLQKPSYIGNTFPPFRDSVINIIGDEKAMYGKVVFQANVEDTKFLSHVTRDIALQFVLGAETITKRWRICSHISTRAQIAYYNANATLPTLKKH
ncbi:hypothetical protein FPQ18DRAFT_392309 [Pyronema domesticum]|uniref:Uncharacterized protein n=1 Tax=Pyronema omphalodes (strain CBS 100304) TaxID=1076935 RepID=U4KXA2_PYROM|nr:hypothetical protein FPQ18DRAFT_392309 [Pyronema domesticum]CCX06421.1 Protein of unknown function [Pyronema omphalodes CBS 100304]